MKFKPYSRGNNGAFITRLLLAQATTDGMMLMSADTQLHAYAHPVMAV
jgi:PIN domain nuclease of toxin-antitoxin system